MHKKLGLQVKHSNKIKNFPFFSNQMGWLKTILVSIFGSLLLSSWTLPAAAATTESPQTCYIGVYLSSLRDFNPSNKSFYADFWMWSRCPSQQIKELEQNDFLNAKELTYSFNSTVEKVGNTYYSSRKVSGIFYNDWNLVNFPFDRHVLQIPFENSEFNATSLVLKPDTSESTYSDNIQLDGWHITDFSIKGSKIRYKNFWHINDFSVKDSKIRYKTNFGDPSLSHPNERDYSRLTISITIVRNSIISFFKLNVGAYVAFGISLVTFFLNPTQATLVSGRTSTLVGCLFATLVNLRTVDSVLGNTERLTLSDKIHITVMLYVFATVVETAATRLLNEADREKSSRRLDRFCFAVSSISFIVVNLILISSAAIAG